LHRFYEFVALDSVTNYRNCLEAFWRKKNWPVHKLPDLLAGCTYLIVRAFNARVKLGLDRQMPSLLILKEAEILRNRSDHMRTYEEVPEWVEKVPPLKELLIVPTYLLEGRTREPITTFW
jgi:hypothetical protein